MDAADILAVALRLEQARAHLEQNLGKDLLKGLSSCSPDSNPVLSNIAELKSYALLTETLLLLSFTE